MIKKTESDVIRSIKLSLKLSCPEVIWVDRLQSGIVRAGGNWIHMCSPGTPDLYALLKTGGGQVLFIECKRPQGGRQSDDQKRFEYMVKYHSNFHYVLARSLKDVIDYIRSEIIDKEGENNGVL